MGCAGYTPDELDTMPARDVAALLRYWKVHPPAHEVLAAILGLRPVGSRDDADPSGIATLIARYPDGLIR